MSLLYGTCYDPGTAASSSTASLAAMTALDATNLRAQFTAPPSGTVLVRMCGVVTGATTFPQVLFGVMQHTGGAVVKRAPAAGALGGTAVASTFLVLEAQFIVDGLTPGASTDWDAGRSVEVAVASTAIRWGGPNDSTTNNAYGGFCFEVWSV